MWFEWFGASVGVVPADLSLVLQGVNNQWRALFSYQVRQASFPVNQVTQDGLEIVQGAYIELTLNATRQAKAQSLAECMAARSLGVAVIDVKTGAIDVLASAYSACFQAEFSGKSLPTRSPKPGWGRDKPLQGKLENHAFNGAMTGS